MTGCLFCCRFSFPGSVLSPVRGGKGGGDVYLDVNLYNSFDSSFNVNLFMYSSIDISFVIYPNHNRRHHHLCGWTRCKIEGG